MNPPSGVFNMKMLDFFGTVPSEQFSISCLPVPRPQKGPSIIQTRENLALGGIRCYGLHSNASRGIRQKENREALIPFVIEAGQKEVGEKYHLKNLKKMLKSYWLN
jgi:hypothetical protein